MGPKSDVVLPCSGHTDKHQSPLTLLSATPRRRQPVALTAALIAFALLILFHSLCQCGRAHLAPFAPFTPVSTDPGHRAGAGARPREDAPFNWADIPPNRLLTWHPCYTTSVAPAGLDCARLDLPMDWLDPSDGERVILAVIRLRAAAANASSHRGPVFFNPGGPGGSGIWALRDHGRDLQAIVGDDYDIVSFDPRGVGASVPRIECWGGRAQDRAVWDLQDVGVVDAHPGIVYDAFARAGVLSRVCEANQQGGILRHVGTTYHARDLLEIMEQMGEKRLRYWGFSYGTVLGGTFAAMYPDQVERVVNDGNVDYKEWYHGAYVNFLRDTDKVMDAFYFFCHQVGPLRCALYDATPQQIEKRLDNLLAQIRITPVPISPFPAEPTPEIPGLVTYSKVKRILSTALYQPIYRFQRVATVLAALERGDGRPYHAYTSLDRPNPIPFCSAESSPAGPGPDEDTPDAFPAIMCSDAEPLLDTAAEFEQYTLALQNISHAAGAVQSVSRLSCVGRTIRPKWRFTGPFAANTSFPVLFVNNIADNVTPLVSARNNSAGFPGSVVLVQNSYGHTSLAAASSCTARWVRGYFRGGIVPPEGTICEADGVPFGEAAFPLPLGLHNQGREGEDSRDELVRAVGRLSGDTRWGLRFGGVHYG